MKKCASIMLAIALVVGAGCKKEEKEPVGVMFDYITVTDFPLINNGSGWDMNSTYPDIYVEISMGNETLFTTIDDYELEAIGEGAKQYSWPCNLRMFDMDHAFTLKLLDYDGSTSDLMGYTDFYLNELPKGADNLLFRFQGIAIQVTIEYIYE